MANINWYPGHMAKTKRLIKENINFIDVVFELIDARMPKSSKIIDLEEYTRDKPRIMIMTKYDLCDKKITNEWIKYYESKGYKVIAANIMQDNVKKIIETATKDIMKTKDDKRERIGLKLRKHKILIAGIPNVGKSTLINRLVNKKVANVGNKPGVTKHLKWIRINENLELLDTPGILWPKFEDETVAFNLACLTAIKEEVLPIYDVVEYILETLNKYYPEILESRYGITELNDPVDALDTIGKKRGCLERGGVIDYEKVYAAVINDIKDGYIKNITFDRL